MIQNSLGSIYIIDNGKKRHITSEKVFLELDLQWNDVEKVDDQIIERIPSGSDIEFIYDALIYNRDEIISDGVLIKGSSEEIYLKEKGKKRHIVSPKVFNQLGFSWNSVRNIPDFILEQIPEGEKVEKKEASIGKSIVVIFGGSHYKATRSCAFDLIDSFQKMGYNVLTFDTAKANSNESLEKLINRDDILFLLGINGHGIEALFEKIHKKQLKVPFFALLHDHPMYHSARPFKFNEAAENLIISCIDRAHVESLNKYCVHGKYTKVFIPHGASTNSKYSIQQKPINSRKIDILFMASFTDPEFFRAEWISNFKYKSLMDEIAERGLYEYDIPLLDIAKSIFDFHRKDFNYHSDQELRFLLAQVDLFIRMWRRQEILTKLSGLAVQVYGDGKEIKGKIKFHPNIDIYKAPRLIGDSKIVLNVVSNWVYAGHERLFSAMLARSAVLSDKNQFLNENFKHDQSIYFLDIKNPNLAEDIEELLLDSERLQYIADNGKRIVQENHTWLHRAKEIINVVHLHNINTP